MMDRQTATWWTDRQTHGGEGGWRERERKPKVPKETYIGSAEERGERKRKDRGKVTYFFFRTQGNRHNQTFWQLMVTMLGTGNVYWLIKQGILPPLLRLLWVYTTSLPKLASWSASPTGLTPLCLHSEVSPFFWLGGNSIPLAGLQCYWNIGFGVEYKNV